MMNDPELRKKFEDDKKQGPVPLWDTNMAFSLLGLYVSAFGLMAFYRRSISSIRQYTYLLVIMFLLEVAWMILDPPVLNPLPTPEQESQILNLDLDSILSAKPADPASATNLMFAELSLTDFMMSYAFTLVLDIWLCTKVVQDLEKIETETAQARVQAQAQAQAQIWAHAHSQTSSERTSSGFQQGLHEKQD
ncbi:hypothetical protein BGZ92_007514 [Podila epicladia]|nr:hypothetical protein BGZ92_007514 [Podila epicladia]